MDSFINLTKTLLKFVRARMQVARGDSASIAQRLPVAPPREEPERPKTQLWRIFKAALPAIFSACGSQSPGSKVQDSPIFPVPLPLSVPVVIQSATCTAHLAAAGSTFMCPANKFVIGISDSHDPFGKFDSVKCCALKAGGYVVTPVYATHNTQYTAYGTDKQCPGHTFMKGIGFDSGGAAGTFECYRMQAGGMNITKTSVFSNEALFEHSSASCNNKIADGLGDTISPDGTIDSLHCRGARR